MGLETRRGRHYYYAKQWNGGRVRSIYCGAGLVGHVAEGVIASERRARDDERQARAEERVRVDAAAAAVRDFSNQVRTLLRAVLIAEGYHEHRRQWRKKRQAPEQTHRAA